MVVRLSRREMLAAAAAGGLVAGGLLLPFSLRRAPGSAAVRLSVTRRSIEVLGQAASVLGITQANGTPGITLNPDQRFRVDLANGIDAPTIVHWHGQTPPADQDGVVDAKHPAITPGASHAYDFAARPGTYWMHSHYGLQQQLLASAPLIVRTKEETAADEQEVVLLLSDFAFRSPEEILDSLTSGSALAGTSMPGMPGGEAGGPAMPGMDMGGMAMGAADAPASAAAAGGYAAPSPGPIAGMAVDDSGGPDLNDVEYDAYLANDRTLDDPLVVNVERNGRVRLRIINGAASTNFWIDLGGMFGALTAVDGNAIKPVLSRRFPIAIGQRLDIKLALPGAGAFPILAVREGDSIRTGVILATRDALVGKVLSSDDTKAGPIDLALERQLTPLSPLAARPADLKLQLRLTGGMAPYSWSLDDRNWISHQPISVKQGQRVQIDILNATTMSHPMHLHGHHFQTTNINGIDLAGSLRDTLLVPPDNVVRIAFDANNPGRWLFHCHNLYHMAAGMMTEIAYDGS